MGGVQYSTYFLVEELVKDKSIETKIFLPAKGTFSILCEKNRIPYEVWKSIPYISTSISFFYDKFRIPNPFAWVYNIFVISYNSLIIKKQLNQYTPQLTITKGLLNHFSSGLACKLLGIPVIWHVQDLISHRYYGLLGFIFNQFAKIIPDHIICDGQIIKHSFKNSLYQKSSVILNGIKTKELKRSIKSRNEIRKELGIPIDAYVIGNLARIIPWKGQEILLRAFIQYSEKNTNSYLILAGSPLFSNEKYYRRLLRLISKNNLRDRVIMPGFYTDLKGLFSTMDLFIYPPKEKDTSPLALMSALSSGLPVVISDITSLEDITNLIPTLDKINQTNLDQLISLMIKYEDNDIRMKNGKNNLEVSMKNFDISIHSKNMLKCVKNILVYH